MDGAADEPAAARGRLCVPARRFPRELPAREPHRRASRKWDLGRGRIEDNVYFVYNNQERKQEAKVAAVVRHRLAQHQGRLRESLGQRDSGEPVQQRRRDPLHARTTSPYLGEVANGPSLNKMQFNWDGGVYVQDQWQLGRFTFNLGARYDKFNAFIPAQSVPDSNFVQGLLDSARSATCRTGTTGRRGPAWPGTCSATARRRSRRSPAASWRARRSRTPRSSTRSTAARTRAAWTDLNSDGKVLNPDGSRAVQRDRRRQRELRLPGHGGQAGSGPEARQELDLRADRAARAVPARQVFGGYYRRHFFDLAWTDNLATANFVDAERTRATGSHSPIIGPADDPLQNGGGEAITIYNLRAQQDRGGQPAAGLQDERAGRLPDLQRHRTRDEHPAAAQRVRDGQPDERQDAHSHLHGGQSEQPAVLRSDDAVPAHLQVLGRRAGAVGHQGERELPDLRHAGFGPVPRAAVLRGEPDGRPRRSLGHTFTGGTNATGSRHHGQPARAEHDLRRLLQDLRHARSRRR